MTMASASSHMVGGSSARRAISDRIENWVVFSPAGAKKESYICDTRRDALRMAPQLQSAGVRGRDVFVMPDSVLGDPVLDNTGISPFIEVESMLMQERR